jgi:hypothetical protein
MIQEIVQKEYKVVPEYQDTPDQHDEKGNTLSYKSEIYVVGQKVAE